MRSLVFFAVCRLFLVVGSGGHSPVVMHTLLAVVGSLAAEQRSRVCRLSSCGTWA